MIMTLMRVRHGSDSTLGTLIVDGEFQCYTLEDEVREEKVAAETAIPAGRYEVLPRAEGGMHPKYAKKYGEMHIGMAHLQDVPNFQYVYIHTGNTDDHTEGCVLVGEDFVELPDGNHELRDSRTAYKKLYAEMREAWDQGEKIEIIIAQNSAKETF